MSKKTNAVGPIIGHQSAWGKFKPRYPVTPYLLSPGSTYVMEVRVREKIDVHGVGMDVVYLNGIFIVRCDHPRSAVEKEELKWGQAVIKIEFRSLELHGQSSLFGTVRVRLNWDRFSGGEVGPAIANSRAAECRGSMNPIIELPELGLTLNSGEEAVKLFSKVIQVPPVGDIARSENSVMLKDEVGSVVGELVSSDVEVGDILLSIPLGNTERRS